MAMTAVTIASSVWKSACAEVAGGTPLLALANHSAQIRCWPDLERSNAHARVLRHDLDGMLEIPRFEYQYSAELLLGFRERTIRRRHLAIREPQGYCRPGGLQ